MFHLHFSVPASPPANISINAINSTSITVNWTEVSEIDQNGIITQYEVMYEPLMTFGFLSVEFIQVDSSNFSLTLMNLEEYVEYNISVRAYTSVGPGPYSVAVVEQTFENGKLQLEVGHACLISKFFFTEPATPPENISVTVIDSSTIKVNWSGVSEINQNGIITQYEVMYEPLTTFGVLTTSTVNTTSLSITLMGLEEYVEYNISVRAYTSVGPGPYSVGIVRRTFEDGKKC